MFLRILIDEYVLRIPLIGFKHQCNILPITDKQMEPQTISTAQTQLLPRFIFLPEFYYPRKINFLNFN